MIVYRFWLFEWLFNFFLFFTIFCFQNSSRSSTLNVNLVLHIFFMQHIINVLFNHFILVHSFFVQMRIRQQIFVISFRRNLNIKFSQKRNNSKIKFSDKFDVTIDHGTEFIEAVLIAKEVTILHIVRGIDIVETFLDKIRFVIISFNQSFEWEVLSLTWWLWTLNVLEQIVHVVNEVDILPQYVILILIQKVIAKFFTDVNFLFLNVKVLKLLVIA